jgi:hypothetical protein
MWTSAASRLVIARSNSNALRKTRSLLSDLVALAACLAASIWLGIALASTSEFGRGLFLRTQAHSASSSLARVRVASLQARETGPPTGSAPVTSGATVASAVSSVFLAGVDPVGLVASLASGWPGDCEVCGSMHDPPSVMARMRRMIAPWGSAQA